MGLETATYINGLDPTWPLSGDNVSEGDNHIILLKTTIQATFPNITGAVTPTHTELNYVDGVTSAIQTQLAAGVAANVATQADVDANETATVPIGGVVMFNAAFSGIPANWQLCDGTNGTPNMTDKFVYGTNTEIELLAAGGQADAIIPNHTHTVNDPGHFHAMNSGNTSGNQLLVDEASQQTQDQFTDSSVTNLTVTGAVGGESVTDKNIPPYIKLAFIQRMT